VVAGKLAMGESLGLKTIESPKKEEGEGRLIQPKETVRKSSPTNSGKEGKNNTSMLRVGWKLMLGEKTERRRVYGGLKKKWGGGQKKNWSTRKWFLTKGYGRAGGWGAGGKEWSGANVRVVGGPVRRGAVGEKPVLGEEHGVTRGCKANGRTGM